MENFRLQDWPDTWPAGDPPMHHAAALRCNSGAIPH